MMYFCAEVVLSLANNSVTEGESVEVCVDLFDRSEITGNASVTLVTDNSDAAITVTGEKTGKLTSQGHNH